MSHLMRCAASEKMLSAEYDPKGDLDIKQADKCGSTVELPPSAAERKNGPKFGFLFALMMVKKC